ncbi:hypothetical protein HMPREF0380_00758 [Eubacterium infirmum F0142]|nr:hypothetical protein HMPREF0380_00758 [Eubacterium infirmum F0142]
MIRLSKAQVLQLHQHLIEITGGAVGIRDDGMLDSALNTPFQVFDDIALFPGIIQKAARLGFGLIKNHPFLDGNKRIGAHTMLVFLELNGIHLSYSQEELYTIILGVASGKNTYEDLLQWLYMHES